MRARGRLVVSLSAVALAAGLGHAAMAGGRSAGPHAGALVRSHPTCPRGDRRPIPSTTAGAAQTLVPAGARTVLLCRYAGLAPGPHPAGGGSFTLVAADAVASAASTGYLAGELNALPPPPTGPVACPADDGRAIIAFFRYGRRGLADDPVTISLTGCMGVTNGHVTRSAALPGGVKLVHRLEFLTRPKPHTTNP